MFNVIFLISLSIFEIPINKKYTFDINKSISYHSPPIPSRETLAKTRDEGSTVTVASEERLDGTDETHTRAVSSLSTLYLG